jgi:hypothetical protein
VNYIDRLATEIQQTADPDGAKDDLPLYRIYALLCLAVGHNTTARDVHDAWSVWQAGIDPNHRSLIPFEALLPEVQRLDEEYVDAIHQASTIANTGVKGWSCARCAASEWPEEQAS